MKFRTIAFVILVGCLMISRAAAEVGFELQIEKLDGAVSLDDGSIERIQLNDHAWSAAGVEQSVDSLPAPQKFDFVNLPWRPPRPRVLRLQSLDEHSYASRNLYYPYWLDEFAWPLTREVIHDLDENFTVVVDTR